MKWILSLILGLFLVSCNPDNVSPSGDPILGVWIEMEDYNGQQLSSLTIGKMGTPTNTPEGLLDIYIPWGYYSPASNKIYNTSMAQIGHVEWLDNDHIIIRMSAYPNEYAAGNYNWLNSRYQRQ